jgi:hypothetical protein
MSYLFIILGVFIYWYNFGWTVVLAPSVGFYSAAFFILIGLIILMRRL